MKFIKRFISFLWIIFLGYTIGVISNYITYYKSLSPFINFRNLTLLLILLSITGVVWKVSK